MSNNRLPISLLRIRYSLEYHIELLTQMTIEFFRYPAKVKLKNSPLKD